MKGGGIGGELGGSDRGVVCRKKREKEWRIKKGMKEDK